MLQAQVFTIDDNNSTFPKVWVNSLALTEEDKRVLVEGEWLTANHISAAHMLLKQAFPSQNGLCDTSYLSEKLKWASVPQQFVQIINVGGCHWACLSNRHCSENGTIELFDSQHTVPESTIKQQACTILRCRLPLITIQVVNVQKQSNENNCGLYAMAMALDLCEGRDPFICSYNETFMRSHIEGCFQQEHITRFPKDKSKVVRRRKRIINQINVELFCICRYPDVDVTTHFGDMACCTTCKQWFHAACMDIPKEVFKKKNLEWFCSFCLYSSP